MQRGIKLCLVLPPPLCVQVSTLKPLPHCFHGNFVVSGVVKNLRQISTSLVNSSWLCPVLDKQKQS